MKISRKLSELLLNDLMNGWDVGLKYHDRLTRAEAQAVIDRARRDPEIARAYTDRAHPNHAAVRTFKALVDHYLMDHPQDAAGEPEPWPARVATGRTPSQEDPFADTTPEEAEAILTWARTRPEFGAYHDGQHVEHAGYVRDVAELMRIAHDGPPADGSRPPPDPGPTPERLLIAGQQEAATLMRNPAYTDRHHPDHAAAVDAVRRAYERAYPEPAASGAKDASSAPAASAPAGREAALTRIRAMQGNPAYFDKHHPEHAATVARMAEAYAEAYPEPAGGEAA